MSPTRTMSAIFLISALIFSCSKSSKPTEGDDSSPITTTTIKYIDTLADNIALKHPGGLHTNADFARVRAALAANSEPWVSGWNVLIQNSHAQSTYTPNPLVNLIRGGGSREQPLPDNYGSAFNDVAAAYQLALRWKISGNTAYADKAILILNGWASTCTSITGDSNKFLASGIYGFQFAVAGELMRDYEGWKAADFQAYQRWMLSLWYPMNHSFITTHNGTCWQAYWSNWDLANLASMMAIGILTDKRVLYNEAINFLQHGLGNGNLTNAIYHVFDGTNSNLAQLQESGRDQGHATLVIALIGPICQMAYNQGDDLFAFNDNMYLKACEYVAKYNVANLDVPYYSYTYNSCSANTVQAVISTDARGTVRPMYSLPYYHYTKIKNLTATYSNMGVTTTLPEGGGGNYGPNSGGFDQLGFGTLMFAR